MLKKLLAIIAFLFYAAASWAANVDVNTASAADLDALKGIGPAISSRIVEARQQGKFKDWEDFITRVKGIGHKNAAKFSTEGLTVGGVSYQGAPATAAAPAAKATRTSRATPAAAPAAPVAATPAAPAPQAETPAPAAKHSRKSKKAAAEQAPEAQAASEPKAKASKARHSRKSKKAEAAAE